MWVAQKDLTLGATQHQVAVFEAKFFRTFYSESNLAWVRPRPKHEVVLEFALIAVVSQVHAGIDVGVTHPRILRNTAPPLRRIVAAEVVALAGQFILPKDLRLGVGAHELHAKHGGFFFLRRQSSFFVRGLLPPRRPAQSHHRLSRRQKQAVACASRDKLYVGIELSLVGFKREWEPAVRFDHPAPNCRTGLGSPDRQLCPCRRLDRGSRMRLSEKCSRDR